MTKPAFTLAEVLITLGIIGIVAAMTLPALVKNYRALVLQNQFKQAYAELNTASRNFYFHNNFVSLSEFAVEQPRFVVLKAFSKEFNNVLKSDSRGYDSVDENGNTKGTPYTFYTMNGKSAYRNVICDTGGWIWDGKGRLIGMDDNPKSGYNGPKICIDINGEKLPNKFGVDFFVFNFTVDGYVIPLGQEHKNNDYVRAINVNGVPSVIEDYCVYEVPYANQEQVACSNFALSNKHPHEEGKDYWHDFINGK
ncbi:type II secretion system protein [bacterium]|nr:type II secretion system protein [bacterium]